MNWDRLGPTFFTALGLCRHFALCRDDFDLADRADKFRLTRAIWPSDDHFDRLHGVSVISWCGTLSELTTCLNYLSYDGSACRAR